MDRIFYQDFLMDFPYDENEFPQVNIKYIDDLTFSQVYGTPYNLYDILYGFSRYLSFQELHNKKKKEFWDALFKSIVIFDTLILVDDIHLVNNEVLYMKDFYLKTYYWNLQQYNKNIYIYIQR